jgi:ribose 5-phosphate isomerase A
MALGLGTGSTTSHFVDLLGQELRVGNLHDITGVPTSEETARRARAAGIPLTTLDETPSLDLTVDGADEVDPNLDAIKGLGHALLREKIVAVRTRTYVLIVDESKLVARLGRGPLPVEIVPFGAPVHVARLAEITGRAELWCAQDGSPIVTDNGNYLARCWFVAGIDDPHELARTLVAWPGVVEHGLFLDLADAVVIARPGGIEVVERDAEAGGVPRTAGAWG